MARHTVGPWMVDLQRNHVTERPKYVLRGGCNDITKSASNQTWLGDLRADPASPDNDEWAANARLVRSAPDLLSLCVRTAMFLDEIARKHDRPTADKGVAVFDVATVCRLHDDLRNTIAAIRSDA